MRNLSTHHLSSFLKGLFLNFFRKISLNSRKDGGSRLICQLFILIIWFLFFPFLIQANNPLDVVINEIAWMGTPFSSNDEWIELYNNTDKSLSLEGWLLKATDGSPKFNFKGLISAKGFYLLERTDDNTLPGIPADQIYKGTLGDKGENLELYDNLGNLIDSVNCSSGWFAGDKNTKQTMERKNPQISGNSPENWTNSKNPGGSPRAKNIIKSKPETELPAKDSQPEGKIKEAKPITYPSGILLNEILPDPKERRETEGEYIEIFNQNSFEVDLSGWKIEDTIGKTTTYIFPQEAKIKPFGFLVLYRPTTKITLNNLEGDDLKLIQPDGVIIDEVKYEKAIKGQSYNRTESGEWVWSSVLTPGSKNIIPPPEIGEAESQERKKIDINTASLEDLIKIVHINERKAQELISLRPFYSLNDLTKIKGIGDRTLKDIKNQGLAWVDPELKPPKIEKEIKPIERGLATVAESLKQENLARQTPKSLSLFLIALVVAIFSGTIILILKNKLKRTIINN